MVSLPDNAHDPRQELDRMDNIVLSALGEPVDPEFSAHLATCSTCQAELDALTHTADLAREGHHPDPEGRTPSAAVWDSIAAELGLDSGAADEHAARVDTSPAGPESSPSELPGQAWHRGPRAWTLAAAAAVLAV